jgi:hypothetical protein
MLGRFQPEPAALAKPSPPKWGIWGFVPMFQGTCHWIRREGESPKRPGERFPLDHP